MQFPSAAVFCLIRKQQQQQEQQLGGMTTKVKGLLKGLRYISQIFDEEKEAEMKIGFPTDVKHVAHIGWDGNGPSADSPSWMKDFDSTTTGYQSAPLAMTGGGGGGGGGGGSKDNPEIKWVSEDSKNTRASSSRDLCSADNTDSPTKKESSRRHSRRSKDSSGNSMKSNRPSTDSATGSESPANNLPDIPKKTRRKKSKENMTGGAGSSSSPGSTRSSRSKDGSVRSRREDKSQTSNLKPSNQSGEMESTDICS